MASCNLPVDKILSQLKARVGVESGPVTIPMEEGAVRKYMRVTGDKGLLFNDGAVAKEAGYDGKLIPPAFVCPDPIIARINSLPLTPNPWNLRDRFFLRRFAIEAHCTRFSAAAHR